jgi:hypothetical protein
VKDLRQVIRRRPGMRKNKVFFMIDVFKVIVDKIMTVKIRCSFNIFNILKNNGYIA